MKRFGITILTVLLGGFLLAAAIMGLFRRTELDEQPGLERIAVSVTNPRIDRLQEMIRYLGTVEGENDALLSFRVGGTIADVHVVEGQYVGGGQRLAELDQPEAYARVDRARTELARRETNLQHWTQELEIDDRLLVEGAVSRERRDRTKLSFENAVSERNAAKAALDESIGMAAATVLRASYPGVVGRVERKASETVLPGQNVLQLNSGRKRVRVDALEGDLARGISTGTPALLTAGTCPETMAHVTLVDATVSEPFGSVRVFLGFTSDCIANLPTGSTASVTFILELETSAIFVPISAIDLRGGSARLFRVAENQIAEPVSVKVGQQRADWQEVRGPVESTDLIVYSGTTNLESGASVWIARRLSSNTQDRRNR